MTLELRHLSGSRAGEVESFEDSTAITVGRNPSSRVRFDPDRDRAVSGNHASITFEQGRWVLRDLGSSNGTFVSEERVTEHSLHSGDVVQFGSAGPKLRVTFSEALLEETGPLVVPAEGRTVMMMMPQHEGGAAPAGVSAATAPRKKKKGGLGRALLIVGAVGVVLLIGLVALLFTIRSANLRKRQARGAQTATANTSSATPPVTATDTAAPVTETTVADAAAVAAVETAEAERLKQQIATTKQNLESAQQSIQKVDPNQTSASEIADLKRQVAESQALMEQMTQQLQEKNDEIAAERARAAAKPKVVYIPAASPQPSPSPSATAMQPRSEQPPVTAAPLPTKTTSSSSSQSYRPPVTPAPTPGSTATPAPSVPALQLYKTKALKLKVSVSSTPPEIPPAGLPSGTDKGLVSLIGTALVSSGDYVVGANGQASVSVMVTNYKADVKKGVNTANTASNARKIGKIFGQKIPSTPAVDVRNVSYDAAMSARVRLLDRTGRVLLESEPSAASADRKSKVALGGVSFSEAVLSDTAVGDVTRKVVADAVDALRNGLRSIDWSTPVSGASKDKVTLGVGSSAFVEPGDVFDIVDGQQRVVASVRVTNVTESTSEAAFLTKPGKERLASMTARYAGNESSSSTRRNPRTITIRAKTPVFDGPGNSFNQVRELKPGVLMNLQFTVGPWGKVEDKNGTVWVPLANTTIGS